MGLLCTSWWKVQLRTSMMGWKQISTDMEHSSTRRNGNWFVKVHKLKDSEQIDDASRGPRGSAKLLCRMNVP
jgi:hypothetical protein